MAGGGEVVEQPRAIEDAAAPIEGEAVVADVGAVRGEGRRQARGEAVEPVEVGLFGGLVLVEIDAHGGPQPLKIGLDEGRLAEQRGAPGEQLIELLQRERPVDRLRAEGGPLDAGHFLLDQGDELVDVGAPQPREQRGPLALREGRAGQPREGLVGEALEVVVRRACPQEGIRGQEGRVEVARQRDGLLLAGARVARGEAELGGETVTDIWIILIGQEELALLDLAVAGRVAEAAGPVGEQGVDLRELA